MKLNKTELKFKELMSLFPENAKYDLTPVIQRIDEVTLGCQMKIELLRIKEDGTNVTDKKVTVLAQGRNSIDAQYNALKLALVQMKLL